MKKISIIFLSFVIFIAPPFAYAGVGKYIINTVKSIGGGVKVEATNTATGAKHVITHGVSSGALGGAIGAGIVSVTVGGGVGLAFELITGLALDAVDWVMDAENNQIKFKEKAGNTSGVTCERYSGASNSLASNMQSCNAFAADNSLSYGSGATCTYNPQNGILSINGNPAWRWSNCSLPTVTDDYQTVSLENLAAKTIDLAKQGNPKAAKTVEDYVKKIANEGKLDVELDASTDISKSDKECSAGYEKVGSICVKKAQDEKVCPADTIKVGDRCIKKPDSDPDNPAQCGDCCDEMMEILGAMAEMNAAFYANSLDNDAQMLINLKLVNDQLDALSNNFNDLLDQARQTNQTLTEINNNQTLHFNELKDAIQSGDADILAKLAEIQAAIDLTNLKLDAVNLNLEKINDNLEKMQKCEETEFNKKICDFIDWVKQEPDATEDSGAVDITDKSEGISVDKNRINFSNQCPAPKTVSISVAGFPVSYELNYQPLCDFFIMLNPFVVGMGGISSALIIAGGARRG